MAPLARYYVDPVCTSMPFSLPRRSGNSGVSVPCLPEYRNALFTSGALPYQCWGRPEDAPVQAQVRLPLLLVDIRAIGHTAGGLAGTSTTRYLEGSSILCFHLIQLLLQ